MEWKQEDVKVPVLDSGVAGLGPASGEDRPRWYVVTCDGRLRGVDFDDGSVFLDVPVPFEFPGQGSLTVSVSHSGRYVAVTPRHGLVGGLYDVSTARWRSLERADYHANVSGWLTAFVRHRGRDVLIHATAWNRLEAHRLPNFERLAPDSVESNIDYFWGLGAVSPDETRLASFGWHWQPVGSLELIDVHDWLTHASDPPPRRGSPAFFVDWWDACVRWLDERRYIIAGNDLDPDDGFISTSAGLMVVDADSGRLSRFVPGIVPIDGGVDGGHFVAMTSTETLALDLSNWEVVARTPFRSHAWHPGARVALSCPQLEGQPGPCAVRWLASNHAEAGLANDAARAVLADALEEQGVTDERVSHLRSVEPHGRRCWAVERTPR